MCVEGLEEDNGRGGKDRCNVLSLVSVSSAKGVTPGVISIRRLAGRHLVATMRQQPTRKLVRGSESEVDESLDKRVWIN